MQAPGQVQRGSREGSEGSGQVRFNRKVPEEVGEALVQSQVRFNRVPEKVPEKVCEALVQSQVRFNRVRVQQGSGEGSGEGSGKGSRKLWCKAKLGLTGRGEGCRSQARSGSFSSRKPS